MVASSFFPSFIEKLRLTNHNAVSLLERALEERGEVVVMIARKPQAMTHCGSRVRNPHLRVSLSNYCLSKITPALSALAMR